MRLAGAAAVILATSACAPAPPPEAEALPRDRDAWTVFQVDVPDRDSRDLLVSFEIRADALGCRSRKGGGWSAGLAGGGWTRVFSAVLARCEEGTIVMEAMDLHEVRVACPKPATREQCEGLLGQISAAR